jgi:hypothetical protein
VDRFYFAIGCVIGFVLVTIKNLFNLVMLLLGAAVSASVAVAEMLNVGILKAFAIGLFVWLFWNAGVAVAFSPYLVSPIGYLNAVAIYVLFRTLFGNLFPKITIGVPLSDDEKRLVQIFRTTKGPTPGAGYQPGPRQAYAPTGPDQAGKGPSCNGPGCADRATRRPESATAGT